MSTPIGNLKRRLLIIAGTIAVAVGMIGVFVPVLPTTPFLLLAATCYMRSSPRCYHALLDNRFCGNYVRNYIEGKRMRGRDKIVTLVLLWLTIGATIIFLAGDVLTSIILIIVVVGVTIHILSLKTGDNTMLG